jgi:hypothetical protein
MKLMICYDETEEEKNLKEAGSAEAEDVGDEIEERL